MCNKCEESMAGADDSGEASQVVGYPTEDQWHNVRVINCLHVFSQHVENIAINQGEENEVCRDIIISSLKDVGKLSKSVLESLLESIKDSIEAIILTMHQEQHFANEDDNEQVTKMCGAYIEYFRSESIFRHLLP